MEYGIRAKLFHLSLRLSENRPRVPKNYLFLQKPKLYPRMERVILPPAEATLSQTPLSKVLEKRKSVRNYSDTPISLQKLSTLLFHSLSIRNEHHSYPSGGKLYPVETYVVALNVEGTEKTSYHYNPQGHCLERIPTKFTIGSKPLTYYPWAETAAFLIVMTARWNENFKKYGDAGYPMICAEAGHAMQNLLLVGTALDIESCPLAGFDGNTIDELLDIGDNRNEHSIYIGVFGDKNIDTIDKG